MIDLIFDCDITMGLAGKDVDDGLALLYLLGRPEIRLLGVTSTFGNSSIDEVHRCLLEVLNDLGRSDIPAFRGAGRPENESRLSPAARFLAQSVRRNPGRIRILASGSTTNLLGAHQTDPSFFGNVGEIVLMGGISEPLSIRGRGMKELNFSSDPEATLYALYAGAPPPGSLPAGADPTEYPAPAACPVTVISANLCLQALLTPARFAGFLTGLAGEPERAGRLAVRRPVDYRRYLEEKILPWFSCLEQDYGLADFYPWDATAALYCTHPGLFQTREVVLRSGFEDIKTGFLRVEAPAGTPDNGGGSSGSATPARRSGRRIYLPQRILDLERYWQALFTAWARAGEAP